MAKHKPLPPFEELDRLLRYEPETGKIYWKIKPCKRVIAGAEAGTKEKDHKASYRRIKIKNLNYYAHRIAWLLYCKEDPGEKHIDHKNHNGLDNRICNLRVATNAQNQYNKEVAQSNITGYKGVFKNKSYYRSKPYFARASIDGNRFCLGCFHTAEEASEAYQRFCKEHHGEFYNE